MQFEPAARILQAHAGAVDGATPHTVIAAPANSLRLQLTRGARVEVTANGESRRAHSQQRPQNSAPASRSTQAARHRFEVVWGDARPVRWLLAGDALVRTDAERFPHIALSRQLAGVILGSPARRQDTIVDFTRFAQRLTPAYVDQIVETLFAEQADILVLFCSNRDAAEGPSGFDQFEQLLNQLFVRAGDYGCPVILNTPPSMHSAEQARSEPERMVYREAMLSAGLKHDALIVDHAAFWEWSTDSHGSLGAWLGTTAQERSDCGLNAIGSLIHRELDAVLQHAHQRVRNP